MPPPCAFQAILNALDKAFWEFPVSTWDDVNNVGLRYVLSFPHAIAETPLPHLASLKTWAFSYVHSPFPSSLSRLFLLPLSPLSLEKFHTV